VAAYWREIEILHIREFLFTDLHEREIRVTLYRGLNMCHLCYAQIDLPDVRGMNLAMGERLLKFYCVTSARDTGAGFKQETCENGCHTFV
jgi:hypothetical protein